jgi:hypothetical protein
MAAIRAAALTAIKTLLIQPKCIFEDLPSAAI